MMIMAQHPQQNPHHNRQKQEGAQVSSGFQTQIKSNQQQTSNTNQNQQQQLEQDGKRTLIKNQLYVIEQLQLENANLRNERDQLQLENEELKFELQMISSSNILHQPSATFKNQQLDASQLVAENSGKIVDTIHHEHHPQHQQHYHQLKHSTNFKSTTANSVAYSDGETNAFVGTAQPNPFKIITNTTARKQQQQLEPEKEHLVVKLNDQNNQQVSYNNTTNNNNNNEDLQQLTVRQATSSVQTLLQAGEKLAISSSSSSSSSIADTTTTNTTANLNTIGKSLETTTVTKETTLIPLSTAATNNIATATSSSNGAADLQGFIPSASTGNNKFLAATTKSTSLTSFNVKPMFDQEALIHRQDRRDLVLVQDDEEQRVKLVEQLYGDSEKVQAAAIVIQRAFRKYQICKRFRTITEQLRHTYQSVNSNNNNNDNNNLNKQHTRSEIPPSNLSSRSNADQQQQPEVFCTTGQQITTASTTTSAQHQRTTTTSTPIHGSRAINNNNTINPETTHDLSYAYGATRAAAWESLSYAANRLAASAAAALLETNTSSGGKQQAQVEIGATRTSKVALTPSKAGTLATNLQHQQQTVTTPGSTPIPKPRPRHQQQLTAQNTQLHNDSQQATSYTGKQQDPVVTAAINFQQLESIRKRQYRVGLNIFNKNPEKGVSFLVAHSFIDSTSPYTKASSSYYQSNQLHFMDKNYVVQQALLPTNNHQNCQLCNQEDNLKRNVAHFLLHRKGLAKEKIGQYLGNLQAQFNQDVLKYYLQELDFYGLQIDLALRKFLSTFRLPGEAQKIEKIVDCFAQRYVQCQQQPQQQNPNHQQQNLPHYKNNLLLLLSKDEIFILTFAIIMLNTDLHSPSLKPTSRMSASQFVNNLRGVFKSQTINESDLVEIYERVKANQITTTPDHVTHVLKVQQGLTVTNFQRKELPNLCVPHRRLVCFCRLFEVYDVNKKERLGQHQREIFLFNDLLLVTKLARRVRANTPQLYTFRQSISLQGLYVLLFQSTHYSFGIKLCQRSNDETIIMFNARNELDQSRFVDDLGESIAEMDEMETIKTHNIIETIHFKHIERLRRHAMKHTTPTNTSPLSNLTESAALELKSPSSQTINQQSNGSVIMSMVTGCDTRNINNYQQKQTDYKDVDVNRSTASTSNQRSKAKFSSMLNLSSACSAEQRTNKTSPTVDNKSTNGVVVESVHQNGLMGQNYSVGQQVVDRNIDPSAEQSNSVNGSDGVHRRCSASSVHSLDSGMFLSRDVSPNQSS